MLYLYVCIYLRTHVVFVWVCLCCIYMCVCIYLSMSFLVTFIFTYLSYTYLTIIPPGRVGYEMEGIQRDATRLVGYNHLISNKREWNNCFIKNAHKISMNLPDIIFLEQTAKDKELPPFTCHTSIKTVNARKDWMNEKSKHFRDEHF